MGGRALLNRRLLSALAGAAALALAASAPGVASAQEKIKIGFLPGVTDPFYQVMQLGVEKAAADLGIEVVTQIPPTWNVSEQTPILDAMVARGDLDYIITAPVEKDQMVGPLQAAVDAGIRIITVDTFLGDGDYENGPVTFPISYIGSDNVEGGRISARGLAKAIGGKGKVYINSTNPNVSSVEGREQGFAEVMKNEFPEITVFGPDYNLDDAAKATQQTAAVLEREQDLAGVFGTNVFGAQGAGRR
jgi:ribose transport system substrate-binding protein